MNARWKACRLRRGLATLGLHYSAQAEARGIKYSRDYALARWRERLCCYDRRTTPSSTEGLRIFWVGANKAQDESGFLQALQRCGKVVTFCHWKNGYGQWYWDGQGRIPRYDPRVATLNDQCLLEQVGNALREGPVHLLMGQMWANFLSARTLDTIRSWGIPVVNISMDDRLPENWGNKGGIRLGAVGLAAATDLVLTTSSETCLWYGVEGCPALFWPLASDPGVFTPKPEEERDIDVSFVGNKYGIREKIVNGLEDAGVRVTCYGAGWPNGPSDAKKSAEIFARSKIILGVGTVGYCEDVFTLKLRDFDAPMAGALYLTHRNPDLLELYEEGKEIECYLTVEECVRKTRYYLAHPEHRRAIAEAACAKARMRDTWDQRLTDTLTTLGL